MSTPVIWITAIFHVQMKATPYFTLICVKKKNILGVNNQLIAHLPGTIVNRIQHMIQFNVRHFMNSHNVYIYGAIDDLHQKAC